MINKLLIFLNLLLIIYCSELDIKRFQNDQFKFFKQFHILSIERKIIVGVRDYILQFNLDDISTPTDVIDLKSDQTTKNLCKARGQPDKLCKNFILVLFTFKKGDTIDLRPKNLLGNETVNEEYLFACGSNSFKPKCTIHQLDNLNNITKTFDGSLLCVQSHLHPFTLLHSQGNLYFGGSTDLLATEKIFVRYNLDENQKNIVKTYIDDSRMLFSDAKFIYSFETKDYVYFLFKETSVEDLICSKKLTSRIGRICKNDLGYRSSMGLYWNTFIKAKIRCSLNQFNKTVHFDKIVDANYLQEEKKLFIIFKNQNNELNPDESVVCTYDLEEIENKFRNSFKIQPNSQSIWSRQKDANAIKQFECNFKSNEELMKQNQKKYQIIYDTIDMNLNHLLINNSFFNFKHIQIDLIKQLKPKQRSIYVVYLMTSENSLVRFLLNLNDKKICFLDKNEHILSRTDEILKFKFNQNLKVILIGSTNQLIKVQISACEKYNNKESCLIQNKDLYCVWNNLLNRCFSIDQIVSDQSSIDLSPEYEQPNFELFCEKTFKQTDRFLFGNDIKCVIEDQTKNRECLCNYDKIEKRNPFKINSCTVDGGWSDWTNFTICKDGKKERTRQCSNPTPSNGGKQCVGKAKEVEECLFLVEMTFWSNCSTKCGIGYQTRQKIYLLGDQFFNSTELRKCKGNECTKQECKCVECYDNERTDRKECIGEECNYLNSVWTECGSQCAIGYQYKQIKDNVFRKRKCDRGIKCKGWSEFSEWTKCSSGKKSKVRYCYNQECEGESKITIVCDPNNDTNSNEETLIISNKLRSTDCGFSWLTMMTCSLLFYIAGLTTVFIISNLDKPRDYFRRDKNKNFSLRSISSPLIRSDKNTYVTNVERKNSETSSMIRNFESPVKKASTKQDSLSINFSDKSLSFRQSKKSIKEDQF